MRAAKRENQEVEKCDLFCVSHHQCALESGAPGSTELWSVSISVLQINDTPCRQRQVKGGRTASVGRRREGVGDLERNGNKEMMTVRRFGSSFVSDVHVVVVEKRVGCDVQMPFGAPGLVDTKSRE